jgi:FkbM family methyltransferase
MNIVQIGTNKSKDSCYEFIKKNKKSISNIYLVEPLAACIPNIRSAFEEFNNVKIFNIAIATGANETTLKFYYPKKDIKSGHASFNYNHLVAHGHREIDSIDIPVMALDKFFTDNNITSCERLYIDTEGYDCKILLDFDYNKYNIKHIEFEKIHSDGSFKVGPIYSKCIDRLKANGFSIIDSGKFNCIATKN